MTAMIDCPITVRLSLEPEQDVKQQTKEVIGTAMDAEINRFQEWFSSQGNDRLIGAERAILKTFLAWKLLYEEDRQNDQD